MAKSLQDVAAEKKQAKEQSSNIGDGKHEEDLRITLMLGVKMLEKANGLQVIGDALQGSADPAQVVGQVLAQVLSTLAEQGTTQLNIDPKIFLAKGGWLEGMLDYIEVNLQLPSEFSDQVFGAVVEIIKAQTQAASQQGGAVAPGPQQAAGPQQSVAGTPMQQGAM